MDKIRVALFERMPLLRAGIAQALYGQPEMEVVSEGCTLEDGRRLSAMRCVDVILMDHALFPSIDFTRVLSEICPRVGLILTLFSGEEAVVRAAFSAGVLGCILKGDEKQELLEAVRTVGRGEGYVSPALAAMMMRGKPAAPENRSSAETNSSACLTYRETQIFKLLCIGLKNREIGTRLYISEKSVKRYVTRIFEKLNVRNRVEAVMVSQTGLSSGPAIGKKQIQIDQSPAAVISTANVAAQGDAINTSALPVQDAPIVWDESNPVSALCFHTAFGHDELAVIEASNAPADAMPWGTHILLPR